MDCWDISNKISVMAVCLISLGHYPYVFHHRPSYLQKAKSKLSLRVINQHNMHLHNSLSTVAILRALPCINIHRAGHYQLEMVIVHAYLRSQWVTHCTDLTAFSCSTNKEVYVANNHLIGDTYLHTLTKFSC